MKKISGYGAALIGAVMVLAVVLVGQLVQADGDTCNDELLVPCLPSFSNQNIKPDKLCCAALSAEYPCLICAYLRRQFPPPNIPSVKEAVHTCGIVWPNCKN